jgi:hypothetical protein
MEGENVRRLAKAKPLDVIVHLMRGIRWLQFAKAVIIWS